MIKKNFKTVEAIRIGYLEKIKRLLKSLNTDDDFMYATGISAVI